MDQLLQNGKLPCDARGRPFDGHPPSPPQNNEARPKNNRRRARRACLACRARKVRCDVVERVPCGNCKWDNTECVVVGRRCGRYFRINTPNEVPKAEEETKCAQSEMETEVSGYDARSSLSSEFMPPPATPTEHYGMSEDIKYTAQMLRLLAEYTGDQGMAFPPQMTTLSPSLKKQELMSPYPMVPDIPSFKPLPGFVKPLPISIEADDLKYLQSKGALTLPNDGFQDALIWSFFEYVYPFMPVLDLDQFLQSVFHRDGSAGQISLLLLQAVLFAGTAHVKMSFLKDAGFQSRRQARKAFFQKVRLLYDFNTESDLLVLVQAILLMTLWYETPNEHRNTWHWIDVAISQAFAAGLHREPSFSSSPYPARIQKLRRRVWWVCFMRDRLVSLGMKRPPRIRDDDYCLSILEEADFETESRRQSDRKHLKTMCSYVQDDAKRMSLARLCIAKAELCRCLKYYLRSRYSIFVENAGDEKTEALRLSRPDDKAAFMSCNEDLVAWQNTLPESCKYKGLSHDIDANVDGTIALSRTILHMIYFAAISGLHRSRFTLLLYSQGTTLFEQEVSKICMQHAAMQVSDMAGEIHKHGLDGMLPTSGLGAVVSAAAVHLLEVRGIIHAERARAQEGYRRCMRVIDSLADMYVAADLAKDAMRSTFESYSPVEPMESDGVSSIPSRASPTVEEMIQVEASNAAEHHTPTDIETASSAYSSMEGSTLGSVTFSEPGKNGPETGDNDLEVGWLENPTGELESFEGSMLFNDLEL